MRNSNHAKTLNKVTIGEHGIEVGNAIVGSSGRLGWSVLRSASSPASPASALKPSQSLMTAQFAGGGSCVDVDGPSVVVRPGGQGRAGSERDAAGRAGGHGRSWQWLVLSPGTQRARPRWLSNVLAESQNGRESFVDAPLLFKGDPAHKVSKPSRVDGSDLLNQDAAGLVEQHDLRTERCRPGDVRRRCDQHHRARQQFVCLDDHSESTAVLFVARSAWRAELVNVTPQHACSP